MNNISTFISSKFKILSIITVLIGMSLFLLIIRIKLTHSFFGTFLIWNLFLAIIPYAITTYLNHKQMRDKLLLFFCFSIWLVFLPNAPYIITDLLHLRLSNDGTIWLDILIVSSFAASGLLLFYLSIKDMLLLLKPYLSKPKLNLLSFLIITLSSFGMYLGRELRYNSWEILSQPQNISIDILNIVIQPYNHKEAWLFTLAFTLFLSVGYWVFANFKSE